MNILSKMQEFAEKRAAKLEPLPLHIFFPLTDLTTATWIGTYSWSNPSMKQRWLDADALIHLHPGIPQVPPEVARDYIRAKYTEPRRHVTEQFQSINEHRAAPLYAKIGRYQDMALVDLKSAYWSIMSIVGWDIDYFPGRWLGKRSDNDDFPSADNKIARSSLVSCGLVTPNTLWTGSQLTSIKAHSMYINYDLWACVQDVLHAIATIALRGGAVHIHTDGYILPMKHANLLIDEIHRWGLMATIKETGDCYIAGVGAYAIGEKRTKKVYQFTPSNINAVYTPDIGFLKPRFAKLSTKRIDWTLHDEN